MDAQATLDEIKRLLGDARRAVICPTTGLVLDKYKARNVPEIDAISEICRVLGAQPRNARDLLHQSLVANVPAAWTALKRDLIMKYRIPVTGFVDDVCRWLRARPSEVQTYVCCRLITTNPDEPWSFPDIGAIAQHVATLKSETVLSAFQCVFENCHPSDDVIADLLLSTPDACRMVLTHPALPGVCAKRPDVIDHLQKAAAAKPATERYPQMAVLAVAVQAGCNILATELALDTVVNLRGRSFRPGLAAAAAVLMQRSPDATIAAIGHVIEALAATAGRTDPSN